MSTAQIGTGVEFDHAAAHDFIRSLKGERNIRNKGGLWNVVLRPLRLNFVGTKDLDGVTNVPGPSVPVGEPLSELYHTYDHRPDTGWVGLAYHAHGVRWLNSGSLRYGHWVGFQSGFPGSLSGPVGNPVSLRYYFRVKGICDMVSWGEEDMEISHDDEPVLGMYQGNIVSIVGGLLRPFLSQRYRFFRGGDWTGPPQFKYHPQPGTGTGGGDWFEFGPRLVVNRLVGGPLHNPGTYFFDRIVACSGVISGGSNLTIGFDRPLWLYTWFDRVSWLGPDGYVEGPDAHGQGPSLFQGNPPPGGFSHTAGGAGSNSFETLYYTHPGFNALSLYPGARGGDTGEGMLPDEGWFTSDGQGNTVRAGLGNSLVVEAMLLGIVAEHEHRVETITDLTAPRLLTAGFPEE